MKKYLYHYTSEDSISKYIINNDFLRFSHLKNTNDPKEILPPEITIGNIDVFTDEKKYYEVLDLISAEIHKYKLLCFTIDDSKRKGFDRPSMWAHYANKHNGCCLKINKQKFEQELEKLKKNLKIEDWFSEKISYVHQSDPMFLYDKRIDLNTQVKNYVEKNLTFFLFSKDSNWSSEKELRYLVYADKSEIFINIRDSFEEIYFGYFFPRFLSESILSHYNIKASFVSYGNGQIRCETYTSFFEYLRSYLLTLFKFCLLNSYFGKKTTRKLEIDKSLGDLSIFNNNLLKADKIKDGEHQRNKQILEVINNGTLEELNSIKREIEVKFDYWETI